MLLEEKAGARATVYPQLEGSSGNGWEQSPYERRKVRVKTGKGTIGGRCRGRAKVL